MERPTRRALRQEAERARQIRGLSRPQLRHRYPQVLDRPRVQALNARRFGDPLKAAGRGQVDPSLARGASGRSLRRLGGPGLVRPPLRVGAPLRRFRRGSSLATAVSGSGILRGEGGTASTRLAPNVGRSARRSERPPSVILQKVVELAKALADVLDPEEKIEEALEIRWGQGHHHREVLPQSG